MRLDGKGRSIQMSCFWAIFCELSGSSYLMKGRNWSFIYIRLFSKYLVSTYYVLGTVLGQGDIEMNKIIKTLLHGACVLVEWGK